LELDSMGHFEKEFIRACV